MVAIARVVLERVIHDVGLLSRVCVGPLQAREGGRGPHYRRGPGSLGSINGVEGAASNCRGYAPLDRLGGRRWSRRRRLAFIRGRTHVAHHGGEQPRVVSAKTKTRGVLLGG